MTTADNAYKTSDFNLAVYLLHKGAKLKTTEAQGENKKCTFVFDVPDNVDFSEILKEWHSEETEGVKHILHLARFLRSEIKRTFNSPAYQAD